MFGMTMAKEPRKIELPKGAYVEKGQCIKCRATVYGPSEGNGLLMMSCSCFVTWEKKKSKRKKIKREAPTTLPKPPRV